MRGRRWRKSVKSFFRGFIDSQTEEELEGKKQETDSKVRKIFALLNRDNNEVKEPLANLIEDFNSNYQLLYAQHHRLTEELRKKAQSKNGKESSSSSSDSSDSDGSSKKRISNSGEVERRFVGEGEVLNEVDDLKGNLKRAIDEKEAFSVKYQSVLTKSQEKEKIIADLNAAAEKWMHEKSVLLAEKASINAELESAQKYKDRLRTEIASLVQDLKNGKEQELHLEEKIKKLEMGSLSDQEENRSLIQTMKLQDEKLVELERIISEKNDKISEKDHGFSSLIEEKKEAIKQLSVLIDYHRNRYDDLKDMILKTRTQRSH